MGRSDIDHYAGLDMWGPVSAADVRELLASLPLPAGLSALDVGCGRGTTLIDLAERLGARITGVDRSEAALGLARSALQARVPDADAAWLACDADDLAFADDSFDVVIANGGPYRDDRLDETLRLYARWLRGDGWLIYGDGFWMQPPPVEYLEATGLPADALRDRESFLDVARRCGFESERHQIASREAWDRLEGTVLANHESYADAHAGDPAVDAMIAEKRAWNAAQQRWGRETMGFSLDVFRRVR